MIVTRNCSVYNAKPNHTRGRSSTHATTAVTSSVCSATIAAPAQPRRLVAAPSARCPSMGGLLLRPEALLLEELPRARMERRRHLLADRLGVPPAERAQALGELRLVLVHRLGDAIHGVVLHV